MIEYENIFSKRYVENDSIYKIDTRKIHMQENYILEDFSLKFLTLISRLSSIHRTLNLFA